LESLRDRVGGYYRRGAGSGQSAAVRISRADRLGIQGENGCLGWKKYFLDLKARPQRFSMRSGIFLVDPRARACKILPT
jgi:hypothetical protein